MQVRAHRPVGEVEPFADVPVRQTLGRQLRDLQLLRAQLRPRRGNGRRTRASRGARCRPRSSHRTGLPQRRPRCWPTCHGPNFDITALGDIGINDRYQFGAQLTGRIGCAWIAEWLRAKQAGDDTALRTAGDALRSSHD